MDIDEIIESRRSVREFENMPITKIDIEEIIKTAVWAPSAVNRQMWHFVAVVNQQVKQDMAEAVSNKLDEVPEVFDADENPEALDTVKWLSTFFKDAPAAIAVLYHPDEGKVWEKAADMEWQQGKIDRMLISQDLQSIGAVVQNILLVAKSKGFGTCWMTMPLIAADEIESIVGVQPPWKLAAIVPIGVPVSTPEAQPRKPLEETLTFL